MLRSVRSGDEVSSEIHTSSIEPSCSNEVVDPVLFLFIEATDLSERHTILDDMHSYRGTSQPPIVANTSAPNQPACDRCGAPLSYGMRAFRVHDSTIDELDSTRPIDPSDSSLFCSKHCADRSMLWFRSKSIADIWDEVQRRVEGA